MEMGAYTSCWVWETTTAKAPLLSWLAKQDRFATRRLLRARETEESYRMPCVLIVYTNLPE
jgi:hypothetical protein